MREALHSYRHNIAIHMILYVNVKSSIAVLTNRQYLMAMYMYMLLMRDEKEERKKQARSNKATCTYSVCVSMCRWTLFCWVGTCSMTTSPRDKSSPVQWSCSDTTAWERGPAPSSSAATRPSTSTTPSQSLHHCSQCFQG